MSTVKLAKAALRTEIEKKLARMTAEERKKQSEAIQKKLLNLPQYKNAKNISVYLSLDSEVNTKPILERIFEDGKCCFVPRYKKAAMQMVELNGMEDWASLPVTKWNIKQPSWKDERRDALETGLDLVICPGVGFTKEGGRLGHGEGYYDRCLKAISTSQKSRPYLVALAFKEQIVEELPLEETDVDLDMVLYPDD
ncbi:unnamed protein product [Phaedon cochleariae]|uniref:5-formyltetrahydrofolate cyclo-ligase n=1 Tax=Phaedon cochleariae TaxID=80249 RepID=A0A9P0DR39_PHACE|nr:unnamed protein product [Phaedon cochleariae]